MANKQDIYQDLLAVIHRHIPAECWRAAQEAAAAADRKERERYGEDGGELDDLQTNYRWMSGEAQDLAKSITHLRRDIDAVIERVHEPTPNDR